MKLHLLIPVIPAFLASGLFAADLAPDKGTEIPESAKRPVVLTLGKADADKLASQAPKAELPAGMELKIAAHDGKQLLAA